MAWQGFIQEMDSAKASACPAVLIIAFNRRDTVLRVMEAVRRAKPARLFVACDGPRAGRPSERVAVEAVREVLSGVDWKCEVRTRFLGENHGCAKAVSSAIGWFLDEVGEGIILEDDCLPAPAFFEYAGAMLERYRTDERIALISGSNMAPEVGFHDDHAFSGLAMCWGWATWRRAWSGFELVPPMVSRSEPWAESIDPRCFRFIAKAFGKIHGGNVHTWDYQFLVQVLRRGQLTVVPRKNLVINIGFDGQGAHFNANGRRWWVPPRAFDFKGEWTKEVPVAPNRAYDRNYAISSFSAVGQLARAVVKVKRWLAFRRQAKDSDCWHPAAQRPDQAVTRRCP